MVSKDVHVLDDSLLTTRMLGSLRAYKPWKHGKNPVEEYLRRYSSLSSDEIAEASAFMRRCLVVDPSRRPTAAELLQDSWLQV